MDLQQRLLLLDRLREYLVSNDPRWKEVKEEAYVQNNWFIPEFIDLQVQSIVDYYLDPVELRLWAEQYRISEKNLASKTIGIVMAGNLPLVGFHDFLAVFIAGHEMKIKLSSRDAVLLPHLVEMMKSWHPEIADLIVFSELLKGCDAYIATGSNNSSRYFDYYFSKFPHIIRRNRTATAILSGDETMEELSKLADDVYQFFGLGCRNVTKLFIPQGYDFVPLLEAFKKYNYLFDHNKYKNNYDYQLAILIINKKYYMTNGSIVLLENPSLFTPISLLNYEFYEDAETVKHSLLNNDQVQCVVGQKAIPFGEAQKPRLTDYADGVDTLKFLLSL